MWPWSHSRRFTSALRNYPFKLVKCHLIPQTAHAASSLCALYMILCLLGESCESSCHQANLSNLKTTDMDVTFCSRSHPRHDSFFHSSPRPCRHLCSYPLHIYDNNEPARLSPQLMLSPLGPVSFPCASTTLALGFNRINDIGFNLIDLKVS